MKNGEIRKEEKGISKNEVNGFKILTAAKLHIACFDLIFLSFSYRPRLFQNRIHWYFVSVAKVFQILELAQHRVESEIDEQLFIFWK